MRRLVAVLVMAILAVSAAGLNRPSGPPGPDFDGPEPPDLGASAGSTVWFCPWAETGSVATTVLQLVTLSTARVAVSVPSPLPGEEPSRRSIAITDAGARTQRLTDIVLQGASPTSIEFEAGPATVSATVDGDGSFAEDACMVAAPDQWWLVGGTTRTGRQFGIRLYNPFPDTAFVSISAVSEFGAFELLDFDSLPVAGRGWVDVDFTAIAQNLDDLVLKITTTDGTVFPSGLLTTEGGAAVWPATGSAAEWFFPVASHEQLETELVLAATGDVAVDVTVTVLTMDSTAQDVRTFVLDPLTPRREAFIDFQGESFGIVVRASEPIASAIVAGPVVSSSVDDEEGSSTDFSLEAAPGPLAAVSGLPHAATSWLVPGPASDASGLSVMWLMNAGDMPATILLTPLGIQSGVQRKIVLPGGSVDRVAMPFDLSIAGWQVEATRPITVGWSQQTDEGIAFISGVDIDG